MPSSVFPLPAVAEHFSEMVIDSAEPLWSSSVCVQAPDSES